MCFTELGDSDLTDVFKVASTLVLVSAGLALSSCTVIFFVLRTVWENASFVIALVLIWWLDRPLVWLLLSCSLVWLLLNCWSLRLLLLNCRFFTLSVVWLFDCWSVCIWSRIALFTTESSDWLCRSSFTLSTMALASPENFEILDWIFDWKIKKATIYNILKTHTHIYYYDYFIGWHTWHLSQENHPSW